MSKNNESKPVELTKEQHNAVADWWWKYHDKGTMPTNEFEQTRFRVFGSAVNALGILDEEAEKNPEFAKSNTYKELEMELIANRDVAAVICAEYLGLI